MEQCKKVIHEGLIHDLHDESFLNCIASLLAREKLLAVCNISHVCAVGMSRASHLMSDAKVRSSALETR